MSVGALFRRDGGHRGCCCGEGWRGEIPRLREHGRRERTGILFLANNGCSIHGIAGC
jgi:hypothetical protein